MIKKYFCAVIVRLLIIYLKAYVNMYFLQSIYLFFYYPFPYFILVIVWHTSQKF